MRLAPLRDRLLKSAWAWAEFHDWRGTRPRWLFRLVLRCCDRAMGYRDFIYTGRGR